MAVTAVQPDLFPAALLRDTPSATPTRPGTEPAARASDTVVFSTAPFRALAELAAAGLRQLATLLPAIEQAVEDRSLEPMIHLAKAAGAAARQVEDGHVALLAAGPDRLTAALPSASPPPRTAPSDGAPQALRTFARQVGAMIEPAAVSAPDDTLRAAARQLGAAMSDGPVENENDPRSEPAQLWLAEAKHLLHRTGDALDQASSLLPLSDPALSQAAPSAITLEIAAAQTQIAAAFASLAHVPLASGSAATPSRTIFRLRPGQLSSATSGFGALLLLTVMSLASGIWWLCLGLIGLTATAFWVWRIGRAARGVALDATR